MALEEIRCRGQRIGAGTDHVDAAVTVAVGAEAHDVARQKLRLADFTMCSTLGLRVQITFGDELERGIELVGEIFRTTAVIGKGRNSRQRMLVAHIAAKTGLHAPDRNQRAGRNAETALDGGKSA